MTQWMALIWGGLLAPATELARFTPGRSGWMGAALAAPLALLLMWLVGKCAGGGGLARRLRRGLGPGAGTVLLLFYMVWAVVLLSRQLSRCALALSAQGRGDGSPLFLVLALGGTGFWLSGRDMAALGRTAQGLLAGVALAGGAVILLSLPQVEVTRLLPLDVASGMRGVLPALGGLSVAVYGAFLLDGVDGSGRWGTALWWLGGGAVLLALAQGVIWGVLGEGLVRELDAPLLVLARGVGVEGAFQRVESLVVALWLWAHLALGALLLRAVREMGRELGWSWTCGAAAICAVLLAADGDGPLLWVGERGWMVSLALGILPAALGLWIYLVGDRNGRGEDMVEEKMRKKLRKKRKKVVDKGESI